MVQFSVRNQHRPGRIQIRHWAWKRLRRERLRSGRVVYNNKRLFVDGIELVALPTRPRDSWHA